MNDKYIQAFARCNLYQMATMGFLTIAIFKIAMSVVTLNPAPFNESLTAIALGAAALSLSFVYLKKSRRFAEDECSP